MKELRGVFSILLLIVVGVLFAFSQQYTGLNVLTALWDTIVSSVKSLGNWSLDGWDIATKVGAIVFALVTILLPIIGFVYTLTHKNTSKSPYDFVLSFLLAPFLFLVVIAAGKSDVNHLLYLTVTALAFVFLIEYDIACLVEMKAKKVADVSYSTSTVSETNVEETNDEVVSENNDSLVEETNDVENTNISENEEPLTVNNMTNNTTETFELVENESTKRPTITYEQRLSNSDSTLKETYSVLKNHLLKHRKVKARISKSCETFRVGYDMVARLVVAGKGLKLYLALDPYSVDSAIYHQRDASSKKRFVNVPLVVKVKSPLSLKKALKLIDMVCEKKEILPKSRYQEVDYSKITV